MFEFYSDGKNVLHPLVKNQNNKSTLSLTDLETLYIQSFKMDSLFNFKFEARGPGRMARATGRRPKGPQLLLWRDTNILKRL